MTESKAVKKLYGYARVSTVQQKEDRQLIALEKMGVARENIYVDKQTGKNFDRPMYQALLKRLDENSVLFVKSLDRLGRNYQELHDQWRLITKDKKADIVVLDAPLLDTRREKNLLGTLISDLLLSLLSYCSVNEYNLIHQRQAEGIAAARAKGVKFGRPQKPLPDNFQEVYLRWQNHDLNTRQAAELCKMPLSSFKYKAKKFLISK